MSVSSAAQLSDTLVSSVYFISLSSLKIAGEMNLKFFSPTCAFMDKVDELIACLVLAVTFNGESIFLEQACEMHLRVAWGAKEALTCLQVCFDVFSIHGFQHVSEHHALWQADQNIDFFSISCIFYFLASCGFCGADSLVRMPS